MTPQSLHHDDAVVSVQNADGASQILLVCEHASNHIPANMDDLGVTPDTLQSHVAWDPGAQRVASALSEHLDAVLVHSTVSRLVHDCNRPPDAHDAMPFMSETYQIPGNQGLSAEDRAQRTKTYYDPFRARLAQEVARKPKPIIVTVHSFTPIYHGQRRSVEIGVLHDVDSRLADALLDAQDMLSPLVIARNNPYGPQDGVTHTLKEHALAQGHLNVMLEIRNDLIRDLDTQNAMAGRLALWLKAALSNIPGATCKV